MKARAKKRRSTGPNGSFKKKTFRCNQHTKVPPSQTVVVDDIPSSPVVASSSRRKIEGEGSNIILDGGSGILDNDSSSLYIN